MSNLVIELYDQYVSTFLNSYSVESTFEFARAKYALIEPYAVKSLAIIGPFAFAAACGRNAIHGPRAFRLAFAAAFAGALVCVTENILISRGVIDAGTEVDFRISQLSSAFDIFFSVLICLRVELPQMRAAFSAATAAVTTVGVSYAISNISVALEAFQYTTSTDEAMSAITSAAAGCALTGWAFRYGALRTVVVAICSMAILMANLHWWSADPTILTLMRIGEVVLAIALTVGIPLEDDAPLAQNDNDSHGGDDVEGPPMDPPQGLAA